jgi:hypothetical protein
LCNRQQLGCGHCWHCGSFAFASLPSRSSRSAESARPPEKFKAAAQATGPKRPSGFTLRRGLSRGGLCLHVARSQVGRTPAAEVGLAGLRRDVHAVGRRERLERLRRRGARRLAADLVLASTSRVIGCPAETYARPCRFAFRTFSSNLVSPAAGSDASVPLSTTMTLGLQFGPVGLAGLPGLVTGFPLPGLPWANATEAPTRAVTSGQRGCGASSKGLPQVGFTLFVGRQATPRERQTLG